MIFHFSVVIYFVIFIAVIYFAVYGCILFSYQISSIIFMLLFLGRVHQLASAGCLVRMRMREEAAKFEIGNAPHRLRLQLLSIHGMRLETITRIEWQKPTSSWRLAYRITDNWATLGSLAHPFICQGLEQASNISFGYSPRTIKVTLIFILGSVLIWHSYNPLSEWRTLLMLSP